MKTSNLKKFLVALGVAVTLPATAMAQTFSNPNEAGDPIENPPRVGEGTGSVASIFQHLSNTIDPSAYVNCNAGGITTDNYYMRRFSLTSDHGISYPFAVDSVDFGVDQDTPGAAGACAGNPITVNIYSIASGDALQYGNLTLVETASINLDGSNDGSIVNIEMPNAGSVQPATDDLVVEIASCDHFSASSGGQFTIGANTGGEIAPSYLSAPLCGISEPFPTGALAFPVSHIVTVNGGPDGDAPSIANFAVNKDFDDDNEASVEVTISCNTGLPLEQTTTIEEGDGDVFVLRDFETGAMDCSITESTPDGYAANYFDGANNSADSCEYEEVFWGSILTCNITNSLQESEVEVTKEWIDENPEFDAINYAEAFWSCSNTAGDGFGGDSGYLEFVGNPGIDSFFVFPDWEAGTTCSVVEVLLPDGGIEVDDSDCQSIVVFPGEDASCTIVNTRLYEGIPTLSQYGLALMALLMLGVGFIGFRRFV